MMRKKPMLAHPVGGFERIKDNDWPLYSQPKLDGVRCLIQCDDDGYVTAYSRTGKIWRNIDHILQELVPFFQKYPDIILDGELYNHDLRDNFEKIISLVRKTKPTNEHRLESKEMVQFHCYDIIDEELPFDQRIKFVNESLMLLGDSIHAVSTTRGMLNEDQVKAIHQMNLNTGYEGSIVRLNTEYQCKRSHSPVSYTHLPSPRD